MGDLPLMGVSARLSSDDAERLAKENGLHEMGVRPALSRYIRAVWARRSFVWHLSASRAYSRNQGSYLGQAWSIITPILDATVFIIVFGFVFRAERDGISNIAAFITVGTFAYALFQRTVTAGVNAIPTNLGLVRSHQFPRAVVPLATSMTEAVLFAPTLVVMLVLSFLTGFMPRMGSVFPTWTWLLLPAAALLFTVFSAGLALFFARLGARTPDIANVIPFFLQLGRFGSGVMFSVTAMIGSENRDTWWALVVQYQPITVFIDLFRACIFSDTPMTWQLWVMTGAWAVGAFVLGFIFFWRAEETYGRD